MTLPPFLPRMAAGDSVSNSSARLTAAVRSSYARSDSSFRQFGCGQYAVRFLYHVPQGAEIVAASCHAAIIAATEGHSTACCYFFNASLGHYRLFCCEDFHHFLRYHQCRCLLRTHSRPTTHACSRSKIKSSRACA